jgi:hypothetical protein
MAVQVRDVGRNEPCPCGSGKKYKQCHASQATRMTTGQMLMVILVSVILVGGLVLAVTSRQEHTGQASGVWSEEHGHYH